MKLALFICPLWAMTCLGTTHKARTLAVKYSLREAFDPVQEPLIDFLFDLHSLDRSYIPKLKSYGLVARWKMLHLLRLEKVGSLTEPEMSDLRHLRSAAAILPTPGKIRDITALLEPYDQDESLSPRDRGTMLTNTQGGSKTIPAIALGSIALEILEKPSVSLNPVDQEVIHSLYLIMESYSEGGGRKSLLGLLQKAELSAEQRNARIEMVDRMTAGNALPINGEAQQLQPAGLLDSTSDLSKLSEEGDFVQGRPRPGLNSGKATVGALEDRIGGKLAV